MIILTTSLSGSRRKSLRLRTVCLAVIAYTQPSESRLDAAIDETHDVIEGDAQQGDGGWHSPPYHGHSQEVQREEDIVGY